MPRPPSLLRQAVGNRYVGVAISDTDLVRVSALARWYCLSTDHLVRIEQPVQVWHPGHHGDTAPPEYAKAKLAIRRRLSRLARIEENPAGHSGPLVRCAFVDFGQTGWHTTPYGVTVAGLAWRLRPTINPAFVGHAFLAADIGGQVERWASGQQHGLSVLSEREVSTGVLVNGDQVDMDFGSDYLAPTGGVTVKRPDLALLSTARESYVAVEVERQKNKPRRDYETKLTAYRDDPRVRAVWYVCTTKAIADRVGAAANKVLPSGYPLRIRVAADRGGWYEMDNFDADANLLKDLEQIR